MSETSARDAELTTVGRKLYGPTEPGGSIPCKRHSALSDDEVAEVIDIIASGRRAMCTVDLPERLHTRDWDSVTRVLVGLDRRLARPAAGWKIGAAGEEVRRAEGVPEPAPGRLYQGAIFDSGAVLSPDLFINYRNTECEFAFQLEGDLPRREHPYTEDEVRSAVGHMVLALEIGDMVFADWYGASGYLGSCLDNGGGCALVQSEPIVDWHALDLPNTRVEVGINGRYVKEGFGRAAMGHPLTSLTWLTGWLSRQGMGLSAGDVVSTGTLTGHCFAAPGDRVVATFGGIGEVEVCYGT